MSAVGCIWGNVCGLLVKKDPLQKRRGGRRRGKISPKDCDTIQEAEVGKSKGTQGGESFPA